MLRSFFVHARSRCCLVGQQANSVLQLHTCTRARYAAPVVLSFKDVCFGFGAKEILEDVNFSVRDGSKVRTQDPPICTVLDFPAPFCLIVVNPVVGRMIHG